MSAMIHCGIHNNLLDISIISILFTAINVTSFNENLWRIIVHSSDNNSTVSLSKMTETNRVSRTSFPFAKPKTKVAKIARALLDTH